MQSRSPAAALVLWLGLSRTAPNRERVRQAGVLPRMALAYSRKNPRLALAFAAAFIGRGDFTVIGYFFSLWVTQVGIAEGLSAGQSLARAGMLFGVIQLAAVAWAFAMGMIMDRVNRVTGIALAFGLATSGYAALGQVGDPFAPGALLGQEARVEHRGPVVDCSTSGRGGRLSMVLSLRSNQRLGMAATRSRARSTARRAVITSTQALTAGKSSRLTPA
jgi:MFS family permease